MKNKSYRLIASDLDGTLLKNNMTVSVENEQAIEELTKRGIYFVPSSGRTLSEFPKQVVDNPNVRYIIHSTGAVVYDKRTEKRFTLCISHRTLIKRYSYEKKESNTHVKKYFKRTDAKFYYRGRKWEDFSN